jgi:hypothetical protein
VATTLQRFNLLTFQRADRPNVKCLLSLPAVAGEAFGVEIFAVRFVSTSDFALFPCSITIDSNFSRPYSFPQSCWMQSI